MIREFLKNQHILQNVQIQITEKCNLKCRHCYVNNRNIETIVSCMSADVLDKIIKECVQLGVFVITLTGGEPFMHPDLWNIIEKIKEYGILVNVQTNGTLINERNIIKIKENINCLYLTNYGYDSDSYSRTVNVYNKYSIYKQAVYLLKKNNISYKENYTMTCFNSNRPDLIVHKYNSVETHITYSRDDPYSKEYQPGEDNLKTYFLYFDNKAPIRRDDNFRTCGIAQSSLSINCNGDVMPCPAFTYILGNINYTSLIDIWKGNEIRKVRDFSLYKNFTQCHSCNYEEYNKYICVAYNYNETGCYDKCSETTCNICRILSEVDKVKYEKNHM